MSSPAASEEYWRQNAVGYIGNFVSNAASAAWNWTKGAVADAGSFLTNTAQRIGNFVTGSGFNTNEELASKAVASAAGNMGQLVANLTANVGSNQQALAQIRAMQSKGLLTELDDERNAAYQQLAEQEAFGNVNRRLVNQNSAADGFTIDDEIVEYFVLGDRVSARAQVKKIADPELRKRAEKALEGAISEWDANKKNKRKDLNTAKENELREKKEQRFYSYMENVLADPTANASLFPSHGLTAPFHEENGVRSPFKFTKDNTYNQRRTMTGKDGKIVKTAPHTGTDISSGALPQGTNVPTVDDGYVVYAGGTTQNTFGSPGYGAVVVVKHKNGLFTLYGHNSELLVKTGQYVKAGQVISKLGNSGNSSGPHMHFEVRMGTGTTYADFLKSQHFDPKTFNWAERRN